MIRIQTLFRSWFTPLPMLMVLYLVSGPSVASGAKSGALHWAAWDTLQAQAEVIPALRYAFYAYRTFSVPYPEIYLKSDSLFSEVVEHLPGSQAAYFDRDGRNLELYRQLQRGEGKGGAFSWTLWSILPDSIFDTEDSTLSTSWLDRRLPSAAVLLRATSRRLSTAEAAAMIYTQMRRTGKPDTALFVIIDTQGRGYLLIDSSVVSPRSLSGLPDGGRSISPAIVFNERAVYYPLFGRDDRSVYPALARAVEKLGAGGSPRMTAAEKVRAGRMRTVAELPNEQAKLLAAIVAFGGVGTYDKTLQKAWAQCLRRPADSIPLGCESGMVRTAVYWADQLSAPVAQLTELSRPKDLAGSLSAFQVRFLELCGRPVAFPGRSQKSLEAWGNLWSYELIDISFDDIIRTRSGQGSSQALAMSAVLDLVGVPYYRLEVNEGRRKVPDQHWIITDHGRWQFNLGVWTRVADTMSSGRNLPLVLASYGTGGRWVNFDVHGVQGDADNLIVSSDLTQVAGMMPEVAVIFLMRPEMTTAIGDLMLHLADDQILCRRFPWPALNTVSPRGQ